MDKQKEQGCVRMGSWFSRLMMVAAVCLVSSEAMAQDMVEEEEETATLNATPDFSPGISAAGMGQAQNALSMGTNGVFNNPAGIARAYMFALEGGFIYTDDGNVLSAAIVDSKTNPKIAAGVGFNYYFSRTAGLDLKGIDVRLPVAIPVVQDRVSVGVAGRYLKFNAGDIEVLNGFTLDAGAIFRVVDQLSVGISAKNLIDPCENATCQGWAPLLVGGGVSYAMTDLSLAADVDADLTTSESATLNIEVGGEYLVAKIVPIRLGFRRLGATESNRATAGVGWRSQTAGLDLSYEHDFARSAFGQLFLGVSIYMQ